MTNRKNMRKSTSLLVCLSLMCALLLACSGCGGSKEKDALVGTWETTIDMTDMVNDELRAGMGSDAEEMMGYFNIDDFSVRISLVFGGDDTYKMVVDEAAMEKSVDNVIDALRSGLEQYFEDLMAQEGIEMSVDELLQLTGIGAMDDLMDEAFNRDDLMSSIGDMNSSGAFKVKDGVMYLTDGDDTVMEEAYELDGSKLTLTGEGVTDGDLVGLYPLVFTKK